MAITLLKFPVVSFRRIENPYEKDKGIKIYIAVVDVQMLPADFSDWRSINPRDADTDSRTSKKIFGTLSDDPSSFLLKNRGLTLISKKVSFDNGNNILSLEMSDRNKEGLLDGGHTFEVIQEFFSGMSPEESTARERAYVKLEILEGIDDGELVVNIVESRNTSAQVKEQSLEEQRKRYEPIKEVLKNESYSSRIAYKEYEISDSGEVKDIDIKDILSYLTCFDAEGFDSINHPIKAYSSKGSLVSYFRDNANRLSKYLPLLPRILELRDVIYRDLPDAYNEKGGRFGGLKGVIYVEGRSARMSKEELPFVGGESSYRIPNGFIYPILASFRSLVGINDAGNAFWKTDPVRFFEEYKLDLASTIGKEAKKYDSPNRLGKEDSTWALCYNVVEIAALRRHI